MSDALHGILVVDKPIGWSSMDVVRAVRRATGVRRVGHAGTLDPLATGVLVVCIGGATRLVDTLMGQTKVYRAEIDLSAFTDTDDREGERREVPVGRLPSESEVRSAAGRFVGEIRQRPPCYSAVHVEGRRAYQLARKGETVELPERTVRIDSIDILGYAWPIVRLRVICGKGTYIRSLARDLGRALGTGGHLALLRREAVGRYDLSNAVDESALRGPIGAEMLLRAE